MILPTRKLILLLAMPAVVVAVAPWRPLITAMLAYNLAVALLVALDLARSARPGQVRVERRLAPRLSLGGANAVGWTIHNASDQDLLLTITDTVPEAVEAASLPLTVSVPAGRRVEAEYDARPTRRGLHEFGDIHLRYPTRMGLALRQRRLAMKTATKVYPNVANLARYRLALHQRRLMQLGLATARRAGRGGEFESLHDYAPGDDPVDISWKTTARRGRLTTRQYQSERGQNILLVIDCGRLMSTEVRGMSRLNYAVNASLLLTYVAVRQGDYVGMVAFSDRIESYMPPTRGKAALRRMNEGLYLLEPRLCEPDYSRVGRFLGLRQRKRSLIVIFTDVVDATVSQPLLAYVARFARHHLPMCVTMRNLDLEALAETIPDTVDECYRQAVALRMMDRRAAALIQMRHRGVDVLDAHPLTLTPDLIQRYVSLKQRHRL